MESSVGILAYGSLIDEPGDEIGPLTIGKIPCITPFNVEYARMSKSRDYAPTLIPVKEGGAPVSGFILVLKKGISLHEAKDMLWRREIRERDLGRKYKEKTNPGIDEVQVITLDDFHGINKVIYTSIGSNLALNSPPILANLSIKSILNDAGSKQTDGIRYLQNAIKNKIVTPLTEDYVKHILDYTQSKGLEDAIDKLDLQRPKHQKDREEFKEFENQVIEISDLICQYGFNKTLQNQELKPADLVTFIEKNREVFLKNCHEGFKIGQQKILALMLSFEVRKDKLKLNLKNLNKKADGLLISETKDAMESLESREHILRHLIDTIAWQMIGGQLHIARRLYHAVQGEKRLLKSNIESVIRAAEQMNLDDSDFALITDLSSFIQSGDMIVRKGDGALVFVEVKEGPKNQEILNIIERIANVHETQPVEKLVDSLKGDKKSIEQFGRNLKQFEQMLNLTSILNHDKGTDSSGRSIKIITPKEDTPRFEIELHKLQKAIEKNNLWSYNVLENCLHIGLYKGPLKFIGPMILRTIGEHQGENYFIIDFLQVIKSLNKPLLFLPFTKGFLFDILFGRTKLYFMLDVDKYFDLFQKYGLKAEWMSKGETMKVVENKKNNELFMFKNRGVKVSDGKGNVMHLGAGIFGKIFFEHIYPSYTAYSCRYYLEFEEEQV